MHILIEGDLEVNDHDTVGTDQVWCIRNAVDLYLRSTQFKHLPSFHAFQSVQVNASIEPLMNLLHSLIDIYQLLEEPVYQKHSVIFPEDHILNIYRHENI